MRLLSSELAMRAMLALRQSRAARLTELAGFLQAGASSLQRALEILVDDGVVQADGEGRRRAYRLREGSELLEHIEQLAEKTVDPKEALAIVARANPALELLAIDRDEVVVVFGKHGKALDQSRAAKVIGRIARRIGLSPRLLYHEDVRLVLLTDSRLRDALGSADVLYGTVDVSFPDRSQHRRGSGTFLGRINPDLRLPSRRTLSSLKRGHGVRSLRVFGSAVRSDFRRDSDVDVAVRLAPGIAKRAEVRASLEEELERQLQRDVDVVLEDTLQPWVRELVDREGVAL